jgi:exodeoxyribonuclease-5
LNNQSGIISTEASFDSWSDQQRAALDAVDAWLECPEHPYFYLAGFAGVGKTTLASEIAERAGGALFAAFTGKAASVLRKKGCDGASTIDSLLYLPQLEISCTANPPCQAPSLCGTDDAHCRFRRERHVGRTLNEKSEVAETNLVIIDECSMVGAEMGNDLLSFGTPVLVLGDPGQLPPIKGTGFFTSGEPDVMLTEIHRQAAGSPIIQLATFARKGQALPSRAFGESEVLRRVTVLDLLNHDQVICGTHRMRHRLNAMIREKRGYFGDTPVVGEKLMCLKNFRRIGLYNGTMWRVVSAAKPRDGFVRLGIEEEDSHRYLDVNAPVDGFLLEAGGGNDLPGQPFTYGYVVTCHKSQGSQWGSVLVIDESKCFREDRCRWLYTAITRAAERVTVARHVS